MSLNPEKGKTNMKNNIEPLLKIGSLIAGHEVLEILRNSIKLRYQGRIILLSFKEVEELCKL